MSSKKTVYQALKRSRPGILALLDPDRVPVQKIKAITSCVCEEGVAGILVGSSLLVSSRLDSFVAQVKKYSKKPVILFPGGSHQVSCHADAIFFLSLLSGRNAEFLIGEQVKAVFLVKEYGLEVIPVGYMLIESGSHTAVEYMSNTKPIPRNKTDIAVAHALAGEYLGMKCIYLEAGSGALQPVPTDMVKKVKETTSLPLIVGGGIRTKKDVQQLIQAGADFLVLGSIIEKSRRQFKELIRSLE